MKKAAIYLLRFGLNFIYFFLKLLPAKGKKVLFLSRQSSTLTLDFEKTESLLKEMQPDCEIVNICHRLEGEQSGGILEFAVSTLKSMRHMADASVCVLDAYWPAVSVLHHKKSLTMIQMWHALGKIKQSGYQTLGKESGRSEEMARLMKMHRGYDYIIAGGEAWNPFYVKSFDTVPEKLVNCGLPRIDHLLETGESNRKLVLDAYPELKNKTVILYAPTFRRNIELNWEKLISEIFREEADRERFALIVKGHPNQNLVITDEMRKLGVYDCPEFKSVDILSTADYLITDYSAIAIEGAILSVKTLYFCYDYEEYREKNGMNIDLFDVMPGCVFRDAEKLCEVIRNNSYDQSKLDEYRAKYLPKEMGTSTRKIVQLIMDNMK